METNQKDLYYMTIRISASSKGAISQADAALHKITPTGRFKPLLAAESFNCNELEKDVKAFYKKFVKDKQSSLKVGVVFVEGYPLRRTGYVDNERLQSHIEDFDMQLNGNSMLNAFNRDEKPSRKYTVFQTPKDDYIEDNEFYEEWPDNWSKQEYTLAGLPKEAGKTINKIIKEHTSKQLDVVTFKEALMENISERVQQLPLNTIQHLALADEIKNTSNAHESKFLPEKAKKGSFVDTYMESTKEIEKKVKRSRTRSSGRGM